MINNNANISIKEQMNKNRKEKKINSNNTNFKNKKKNISNNHFSYDNPSLEFENLSQIENDYDAYISNLKMKLLKERSERKKKEEEAVMIQHRLTLLKNQEQTKLLQLKNVKQHIDRIINNRIKAQEKLNEKLIEKKNSKNNMNISLGGSNSFSLNRKYISSSNFSHKTNKAKNLMSNSQSNFYNPKIKNFDIEKKDDNSNSGKKNEKNTIDNSDIKKRNNNFNIKNSDENKKLFKEQLLENIKKDEEERRRLEEEIAKIEEEENRLLNKLNIRGISNNRKEEGYNNDEFDFAYNNDKL